ncbi:hypothetical protein PIB30_040933 [Stylosanthes scabra]|uniref:Uncharacterized protein n=1 Tax=Stylosanthes scabra TaxID=79078 RepID=A0ABU6ZDF5_9FABA|nr:hypothetical protein [Stylosanthes scabra]
MNLSRGSTVQENFVAPGPGENPVPFTHHLPTRDKGKGIADTGEEGSPPMDMDVYQLSSWAQLEATTQFCGLFKSTDGDEGPSKILRLERVDITPLGAGGGGVMTQMQALTESGGAQVAPTRQHLHMEELIKDDDLRRQTPTH